MKIKCIECGDVLEDYQCNLCNGKMPRDYRCEECHKEIVHAVVEFNSGRPLFGGRTDIVDDNIDEPIVPNITPRKWE